MNLYITNLSNRINEDHLKNMFREFGLVRSVKIERLASGLSKGFGFIEMPVQVEGEEAIKNINGRNLLGKFLVVKENS